MVSVTQSFNLNITFLNHVLLFLILSCYPVVPMRLGRPRSRPHNPKKISGCIRESSPLLVLVWNMLKMQSRPIFYFLSKLYDSVMFVKQAVIWNSKLNSSSFEDFILKFRFFRNKLDQSCWLELNLIEEHTVHILWN